MGHNEINILLLEDNPHDVRLFTAVVGNAARVIVASDGAEALDRVFRRGRFQSEPFPDILVVDLNVPLINGHEVLNTVKANSSTRRLPVVVWTVSDNPRDIRKAFDLGASAYMLKGIDFAQTDDRLHAFIEFWLKNAAYPPKRTASAIARPVFSRNRKRRSSLFRPTYRRRRSVAHGRA
jgi:CheY-like chemotaxis protein